MGYTHYFRQQRQITDQEWSNLTEVTNLIFRSCIDKDLLLRKNDDDPHSFPVADGREIYFNGDGVDDQGHEPFVLEKPFNGEFVDCKTACKPYDVAVVAVLCAAKKIAPDWLKIGSDGNMVGEDWEAGRNLYKSALELGLDKSKLGVVPLQDKASKYLAPESESSSIKSRSLLAAVPKKPAEND